jgi:hypothetical protein
MSGSLQGDIGRLEAAASASTTGRIPIFQSGELKTVTPDQIASGASAVDGPASATDNAIARFDGTTGKLIQNSAATIADTTGALAIGPITQTGAGANVFNSTSLDADFTVKKLTSGNAIAYDAGAASLALDSTTVGITGATTVTGATVVTGALTQATGAIILNNGATDNDFTAKKLTSGNWLAYDAGTDALLANAATVGVTGATTVTGALTATGNIATNTAGSGLQIKEGSNARMGTSTLSGGTIAVANTSVATGDRIFIQRVSGTSAEFGHLSYTISNGVSFTINSTDAQDDSVVNWLIVKPTA